jgi:hypothetical protein
MSRSWIGSLLLLAVLVAAAAGLAAWKYAATQEANAASGGGWDVKEGQP